MTSKLGRDLKKHLSANGCYFERQGKGDHEIWFSPHSGKYFAVDDGVQSRHTVNAILKQAGLPKQF
jgi:predicted RNA binding protein YcfA (HicA-like mRNA interferase family)